MVKILQRLKIFKMWDYRHAEHHAKNRTTLRGLDQETFFYWPLSTFFSMALRSVGGFPFLLARVALRATTLVKISSASCRRTTAPWCIRPPAPRPTRSVYDSMYAHQASMNGPYFSWVSTYFFFILFWSTVTFLSFWVDSRPWILWFRFAVSSYRYVDQLWLCMSSHICCAWRGPRPPQHERH